MDTAETMINDSESCDDADFDFNLPCRSFKSSFARSLSLSLSGGGGGGGNNNNETFIANASKTLPLSQLPIKHSTILPTASINTIMNTPDDKTKFPEQQQKQLCQQQTVVNCSRIMSGAMEVNWPPAGQPEQHFNPNHCQSHQHQHQHQQSLQHCMIHYQTTASVATTDTENTTEAAAEIKATTATASVTAVTALAIAAQHGHLTGSFPKNATMWPTSEIMEQTLPTQHQGIRHQHQHRHGHKLHHSIAKLMLHDYESTANNMEHKIIKSSNAGGADVVGATTSDGASDVANSFNNKMAAAFELHDDGNTNNVEAVILQNQMDTLQWQLKQMETNCNMYQAVMEEVARFLERYQNQKQELQQQQQQQKEHNLQQKSQTSSFNFQKSFRSNLQANGCDGDLIARWKSMYQVYSPNTSNEVSSPSISNTATNSKSSEHLRMNSSTSSNQNNAKPNTRKLKLSTMRNSCSEVTSGDVDGTFKNIYGSKMEEKSLNNGKQNVSKNSTWKRSPVKGRADSRLNYYVEDTEDKLSQEAYRLLRTINNLLNTSQQQLSLTQHCKANVRSISKVKPNSSMLILPPVTACNSTTTCSLPSVNNCLNSCLQGNEVINTETSEMNAKVNNNNLVSEMLFYRSGDMRESRLSLRSSTDSSVNSIVSSAISIASSKLETDEEANLQFHSPPDAAHHKQRPQTQIGGSSTEDESGFSSISSFTDIGVPLSSTLVSQTNELNGNCKARDAQLSDSRNSTLKANIVGLPLINTSQESSPKNPWNATDNIFTNIPVAKYQNFSSLANEDNNTVLWV